METLELDTVRVEQTSAGSLLKFMRYADCAEFDSNACSLPVELK